MSSLAAVLGWKHNNEPGIRTDGTQITFWPPVLGPVPTAEQIATWTAEFAAVEPGLIAAKDIEALKAVKASILYAAERAGDDIAQPAVRAAAFDRAIAIFQLL